jgi:hypothetical protein
MQMDIRSGKWHLGGYLVHSLKPVDMPGLRRSSSLSFVPRFQGTDLFVKMCAIESRVQNCN